MTTDSFAALLVERLQRRDATQSELARQLSDRGIPTRRQTVHRWCSGTARPEVWKWAALLDVLRVPAGDRKRWEAALRAPHEPNREVA